MILATVRIFLTAAADISQRDYNEDRLISVSPFVTTPERDLHLLGCCDGHGGDACATFVAKQLPCELKVDLAGQRPTTAALASLASS